MMDKIERIIDMTEHPERYSQDELQKMLIEDDEEIGRASCRERV